jgi:pteridine reductase
MSALALVTGAARRLGKAFALTLARLGYDIILHYHASAEDALKTQAEIEALSRRVFPLQADLTQPEGIRALASQLDVILRSSSSPLSLLVNSAASMPAENVNTLSLETWDTTLALNLRAPFLLAQTCAPKMGSGLIVNISDVGAQKAWSKYPSYTVSKAALETLTRLLARAFAPHIRVNAIAPGFVLPSDVVTAEEWERLIGRIPLKRPARTEEITSALEFLIQNQYITGQTLVVDGGYSLV